MHVSWGWIKQRPHFLAEGLAKDYDVTVCCRKSYRFKLLNYGCLESNVKLIELYVLPYSRYRIILSINNWLIYKQLASKLPHYDIIWLTHPDFFGMIKNKIPSEAYVVYDCMDDALEFPSVKSKPVIKNKLASDERQLLKRSNVVLASAHYLKCKLEQRSNDINNIQVVNNAMKIYDNSDNVLLSPELLGLFSSTEKKNILYIGTISAWFDFDLIMESIEMFKNVRYILIGPADVAIPQHEQIIYHPSVEHMIIQKIIQMSDALVMPFMLSDLILAVNPVKVYEYIYSGKPAIIVKYIESEQFDDYVYLYGSESEYFSLIKLIATGSLVIKREREECLNYAYKNTWDARISQITNILN
jgi:hypothetical protein